jgi:hypothetical protein
MVISKTGGTLPWHLEDIDFDRIDPSRIASDHDLYYLLISASFVESGADLYTRNLVDFFAADPEVSGWLEDHWQPEELQHGRALRSYVGHAWPQFDWDRAFRGFLAEYSAYCTVDEFAPTRGLELAARCVVETGTTTLYRALGAAADEPVLKQLAAHIARDEVRHYKHFYDYFRRYDQVEKLGRHRIAGALARKALETRQLDSECALRHVYRAPAPASIDCSADFAIVKRRVNALVMRHISARSTAKMFLRPLAMPPVLQSTAEAVVAGVAQRLIIR